MKDPCYIKINPILHSHTLGFICQGLITANMRTLVGRSGALMSVHVAMLLCVIEKEGSSCTFITGVQKEKSPLFCELLT